MNKELKTMEEKMKQDPNEIMENGLTRKQNEDIQKNAETGAGILHLIVGVLFLIMALKMMM
jgi:hypothetical protein